MERERAGGRRHSVPAALALLVVLSGCDFDVSNPGPVPDLALDDPGAHTAIVGGVKLGFAQGLSWLTDYGSTAAREIQPSGSSLIGGVPIRIELGDLDSQYWQTQAKWNSPHEARWIAGHSIPRMAAAVDNPGSYEPLAEVHFWAGFAHRLLGENFCHAVIDGGPAQHYSVHFEEAVDHFTSAIEIGSQTQNVQLVTAARGARAAAHLFLGNYEAASADAATVPEDFQFQMVFPTTGGPSSSIVGGMSGSYRARSVWNTLYEEYYPETGDPRTAWAQDPDEILCCGETGRVTYPGVRLPFMFPLKWYISTGPSLPNFSPVGSGQNPAPIDLVTGNEMKLLEAEVLLHQDQWQEAMDLVNEVRTSYASDLDGEPLDPWNASNAEEAWTALKRERGIELWLEARRLGDLKRWQDQQAPGDLHPMEYTPQELVEREGAARERPVCFPIGQLEIDTNPNISSPDG